MRRCAPVLSPHGKLAGATGRSPLQGFWSPGQTRNDAQAGVLDPYALALAAAREG